MKVLIIGGTGFISGQIAEKAAAAGHEVVLFNRGMRDPSSPHDVVNGDVSNIVSRRDELLALKPDVVVHAIALTEQHAKDLVSVFGGTKAHLIALSSADCYEAFQKLNRGEDPGDMPVREEGEISKTRHYLKSFGLPDYDKNLMTDVLMQAQREGKVKATVFRLPMVYGPGDLQYAFRHGDIIKRLADGQADIVMSANEQAQIFTYGYVENVAAAVVHSFGLPQTQGQIYNLGESSVRTRRQWAELYAAEAGSAFAFHILPPEAVGGRPNEAPQNFIMDVSKYQRDTGFTDPVDIREAVHRTYDWAAKHPEALSRVRMDYAGEKAYVQQFERHMQAFNPAPEPPAPKP